MPASHSRQHLFTTVLNRSLEVVDDRIFSPRLDAHYLQVTAEGWSRIRRHTGTPAPEALSPSAVACRIVTEHYLERLRWRGADMEFHLIEGGHEMPSNGTRILEPWLRACP